MREFKMTDGFSAFHDKRWLHYDIIATVNCYNCLRISQFLEYFFIIFRFMAILGKFEF